MKKILIAVALSIAAFSAVATADEYKYPGMATYCDAISALNESTAGMRDIRYPESKMIGSVKAANLSNDMKHIRIQSIKWVYQMKSFSPERIKEVTFKTCMDDPKLFVPDFPG